MKIGKFTFVQGQNGSLAFRFVGDTPADKNGKFQCVAVDVRPEIITQLAAILAFTDNPGHAVWHLDNHGRPAPCESCRLDDGAAAPLPVCTNCGHRYAVFQITASDGDGASTLQLCLDCKEAFEHGTAWADSGGFFEYKVRRIADLPAWELLEAADAETGIIAFVQEKVEYADVTNLEIGVYLYWIEDEAEVQADNAAEAVANGEDPTPFRIYAAYLRKLAVELKNAGVVAIPEA